MSAGWVSECCQHRAVLSDAQSGLQISKQACCQRLHLLKTCLQVRVHRAVFVLTACSTDAY